MFCVVSNSCVAGSGELSALVIVREPRKQTARPGFARVGGGSKPNVRPAAVGDACHLETAHDGRAPREGVGFNLSVMLSVRVFECVGAEFDKIGLRPRGNDHGQSDRERQGESEEVKLVSTLRPRESSIHRDYPWYRILIQNFGTHKFYRRQTAPAVLGPFYFLTSETGGA